MGQHDSVVSKATRKKSQVRTVFICSPLRARGDHAFEDNVQLAKDLCKVVLDAGHAPYAPHLIYPLMLDDSIERERNAGINAGLAWLGRADEIWIYAESIDDCSAGMLAEITAAAQFSLPPLPKWMPGAFKAVKWKATKRQPETHAALGLDDGDCTVCVGTGKLLEDHDGRAGYSTCKECEGTGLTA